MTHLLCTRSWPTRRKSLAPMVAAGAIVEAARDAEMGWEDEEIQAMVEDYEYTYSCCGGTSIATPLRRADVLDIAWMLTADMEMRAALPHLYPSGGRRSLRERGG